MSDLEGLNQVALSATVQDIQTLRHTPAGLAVIEMQLDHASQVHEAGQLRTVTFTLAAIALGDMALFLADTPSGTQLNLQGFLAAMRKGSSKIVLHVQKAQRISTKSHTA